MQPWKTRHLLRLDALWDQVAAQFGLLTESEGAAGLGVETPPAELLSLVRNGQVYYPGFQIADGAVRPGWARLVEPLLARGWSSSDVLAWFASPSGWLHGRRPADLLDSDIEDVRTVVTYAARRSDRY